MKPLTTDDLIQYLPVLQGAMEYTSGFLGNPELKAKLQELYNLISQRTEITRRVQMRHGGVDLELSDVQPINGEPMSGYVTNGCWFWIRRDGWEFAYSGHRHDPGRIVNAWEGREYEVIKDEIKVAALPEDDDIPF